MYGTKELNAQRLVLTKQYKGKYFSDGSGTGLVKVTGVIFEEGQKSEKLKLVYKTVAVKHHWNSVAGNYKELKVVTQSMFCRNKTNFTNHFEEVTEKTEKFQIAEEFGLYK